MKTTYTSMTSFLRNILELKQQKSLRGLRLTNIRPSFQRFFRVAKICSNGVLSSEKPSASSGQKRGLVYNLRAPDAPQNVRFCRNPRKMNFRRMRGKKLEKSFSQISKIGRMRTNSDEIQKNKTFCFPRYDFFCGRFRTNFFGVFQEFRKIEKIAEK